MKTSALCCVAVVCLFSCGEPDDGSDGGAGGGNTCPTPSGEGTQHSGAPAADETWTAEGSPHYTSGFSLYGGITLTIEPCAVVELSEGASLYFGDSVQGSKLVARGTAGKPITFRPRVAGTYWGAIRFSQHATGDLAWVSFEGGAGEATALNAHAALMIVGDDNNKVPLRQVRAENVLVKDSGNWGVEVYVSGGFTADSHDLVVTGSRLEGVNGEPLSIQTLPTGRYTGNGADIFRVPIRGSVNGDVHLRELGVPYNLTSSLTMLAPNDELITLTLDPGVTLKLPPAGAITLDHSGAPNAGAVRFLANGTEDKPITLTSSAVSPAPGDWLWVDWESGTQDSSWNHVIVEYGGGDNGHNGFGCGNGENQALLIIHEWTPPAGLIQNSTFRHSAGGGIVSGWRDENQAPNLVVNNTFENYNAASFCGVSMPQKDGYCATTDGTPGDCYL